jgi:outer membrane immunogenic protein
MSAEGPRERYSLARSDSLFRRGEVDMFISERGVKAAMLAGAAALALAAGTASAAPSFQWSGFYVGANAGGGQFTGYSSNYYGGLEATEWGAVLGGTAGVNWQQGSLVFGFEGDIDWSGLDSDTGDTYGGYYRTQAEWNWFATVRARAGLAVDRTQFFATAGIVIADAEYYHCYNSDCTPDSSDARLDDTSVGLAVGVGIEHQVDEHVTAKIEYLYLGLDTENGVRENSDPIDFRSYATVARIGVNWHFDM